MAQFYYTDGKERFGPFSIEELKDKELTPQTLVWKEGLPDWVSANTLSDLNVLFDQPLEAIIPEEKAQVSGSYPAAPKNWLIESVLVTIFCCTPLGIVSIILALLVDTMWREGHFAAAERLSQEAGRWVKYSMIFGAIAYILYFMLMSSGMFSGLGGGVAV